MKPFKKRSHIDSFSITTIHWCEYASTLFKFNLVVTGTRGHCIADRRLLQRLKLSGSVSNVRLSIVIGEFAAIYAQASTAAPHHARWSAAGLFRGSVSSDGAWGSACFDSQTTPSATAHRRRCAKSPWPAHSARYGCSIRLPARWRQCRNHIAAAAQLALPKAELIERPLQEWMGADLRRSQRLRYARP